LNREWLTAELAELAEVLLGKLVNEPADAALEKLHVEVDQKAHVTAGQLEVGKQLRLVNGLQIFSVRSFNPILCVLCVLCGEHSHTAASREWLTAELAEFAEVLLGKLVNEPADAALEKLHVEVDQKAHVTAGQLEVGKQLRLVNGLQLGYSFELNDDQVFNEQINAVTAVDPYIPINNREGLLTVDLEAAFGQLEEHARLVRGLQQAWAKFSMHIDCGSDNLLREVV
jgi:hypothetical protein